MSFKNKKDDHDRPLSYSWNTDPDAVRFLGPAADDPVVRSMVTQAYLVGRGDPEQCISYSRRGEWWSQSCRYRHTRFTLVTVRRAADFLAGEGLLVHHKVPPGNLGWQSSFKADAALMEAFSYNVPILYDPVETIIMRERETKCNIDYRDTRETSRMRRNVDEINEPLLPAEIAHPDPTALLQKKFYEVSYVPSFPYSIRPSDQQGSVRVLEAGNTLNFLQPALRRCARSSRTRPAHGDQLPVV
jgi:hypothetical protein